MPITSPKHVKGVTTGFPPAATSLNNKYYLAWTNSDATISWTSVTVNSAGDNYDVGQIYNPGSPTDLLTQTGFGPALTSFNGQVWMAFLQNPAQGALISSAGDRQPPVIMYTSLTGSNWSTPQQLWDPGLGPGSGYVPGWPGPSAVSSPAMAGNASEMMLAWCEYTTAAYSDAVIYVPGDQPQAFCQVFYSIWSNGAWSARKMVPGAQTQFEMAPALTSNPDGNFYLSWQGQSDSSIWFAKYSGGQWSQGAKLPGFGTSAGQALAVNGSGNLQLVWKGSKDNNIYMSTLTSPSGWSPKSPGKNWDPELQMPAMGTAVQPALASHLSALDVLLAFSGETSSELWVMPFGSVSAVLPGPRGGNHNYLVANYKNSAALQNITVTVVVNKDMDNTSDSKGDNNALGFTFQLNCGVPPPSPGNKNNTYCIYQQYGIQVDGQNLSSWYEYEINTGNGYGPVVSSPTLFTLPKANTIPKGYRIEMKLVTNTSSNNNITALSVNAWDNDVPIRGGGGGSPVEGPWLLPIAGATATYPSPVLNLQFNIGGNDCGEYASFKSGLMGTISYKADSPLMVLDNDVSSLDTVESSDIAFGLLYAYPPNPIVQNINAS